MANRHLSRSIALQALFEWDFQNYKTETLPEVIARNIEEFGTGVQDTDFIASLVDGVVSKQKILDEIIEKAARDWPIDQTPVVDRNVLRLGLYELIYANKDEVPARVAINEAIELGKNFGGERSGKFVNGVLGTVYKEMGEPGKNDPPKKKNKKKRLTKAEIKKLPGKTLGGSLIFSRNPKDKDDIHLAMLHDIFGYWTLPKGRSQEEETATDAATRSAKEELNLDVVVGAELGINEYVASDPEHGKIRKHVVYFLAETKKMDDMELQESGGLDDARWFTLKEATKLKTYDDLMPLIAKGINIILADEKKEE